MESADTTSVYTDQTYAKVWTAYKTEREVPRDS